MPALPENWELMSLLEREKWFSRFYLNYFHDGEVDGLLPDAPEDVRKAYEEFLKEKEN